MALIMWNIFELIKKLKIETPKKADVAIYDKEGSDFLSYCVLDGIEHTVLNARQEYFYFSPKIIFLSFIRLNYRNFINPKTFLKELYMAYSLACLTAISPKVVLTFIDNNPLFYSLSKSYPKAVFYAIQNGMRLSNGITDLKGPSDRTYNNENCSINVVCFGKNEIEYYSTYGVSKDNCYPLGSLKGSYYKHFLTKNNSEQKYILCYVSQYRKHVNGASFPKLESGMDKINTYLNFFLKDTGSKICIAMVSDTCDEYNYYKSIFGDNAIIQPKKNLFSTYNLMWESQVIVTFFSTATFEAFGWGKKILLCNFYGYPEYSFKICDICTVNIDDYNVFKTKLLNLIEMDDDVYKNITYRYRKYFMNYDRNESATERVRRMVLEHISDLKQRLFDH